MTWPTGEACVRVPVPELEGHAAGASLGPRGAPCEVARGGQRAGPTPVPHDGARSVHGGRAAPADWLQLRGRPSRHAGRGGQRVFIRPLA